MLDDLDKTIKLLLKRELPTDFFNQVNITFAAPDKHFPPTSVSLPAIDIFLYDIRENLDLRQSEYISKQQTSVNQATLTYAPVNVTFSYIVTAWSHSTNLPDEDEHRILGYVLKVLLRYPTLPSDILQGTLAGIKPLPRAQIVQQTQLNNLGEFWNAMGGRPKPVVHYAVTLPIYPYLPIENIPLVTSAKSSMKDSRGGTFESIASQVTILGQVIASDTGKPMPEAIVTIRSDIDGFKPLTITAVDGYFQFINLDAGNYWLAATLQNNESYQSAAEIQVLVNQDEEGNVIKEQVSLVLIKNSQ